MVVVAAESAARTVVEERQHTHTTDAADDARTDKSVVVADDVELEAAVDIPWHVVVAMAHHDGSEQHGDMALHSAAVEWEVLVVSKN